MTFEFFASLAKALPSTTLGFVWMSGASLPTRVGKLRKLFALAATALFCACSGGGGGLADSGGMSGTGISQGAVTSFGSVFVNGVEWDLTSSTIEIDGVDDPSESDLRLGMVVRINGEPIGDGKPGPIWRRVLNRWSDIVGKDIYEEITGADRPAEDRTPDLAP